MRDEGEGEWDGPAEANTHWETRVSQQKCNQLAVGFLPANRCRSAKTRVSCLASTTVSKRNWRWQRHGGRL